jgi:hypothetical protein
MAPADRRADLRYGSDPHLGEWKVPSTFKVFMWPNESRLLKLSTSADR